MRKRLLTCLTGLAGVLAVVGARAEDLATLYRQALEHDPAFEAARYTLAAVRERLPIAQAELRPSLEYWTSNNIHQFIDTHTDQVTDVHARLDLKAPLWNREKSAARDQASWEVVQAQAQFELARQDVILRVAQAYFDALKAQDALLAAEAQLQAVRTQLDVVKHGQAAGTAAITDVQEAIARMELAQADVLAARNDVEVRRSGLRQITGFMPKQLVSLPQGATLSAPEPADPAPWETSAREANHLVRGQQAAVEAARRGVARQRGAHLPWIDFIASVSRDRFWNQKSSEEHGEEEESQPRFQENTIGFQLTFPLYSGGGTSARVREAKSQEYRAQAELETTRRNAAHAALQAYSGIVNGLAQIAATRRAVEASRIAVEGNRIGYRAGTRINVDVLNAQQQLFDAERAFATARYDTLLQMLRLKAAVGQLTEEDLLSMSALWDASADAPGPETAPPSVAEPEPAASPETPDTAEPPETGEPHSR